MYSWLVFELSLTVDVLVAGVALSLTVDVFMVGV